jgi:hypothetical protein
MSEHRARIVWNLSGADFVHGKFSREHTWTFDGGATVLASASPAVVRPPLSNPAGVDPSSRTRSRRRLRCAERSELYRTFFSEVQALVARSEPVERVVLVNAQIFGLDTL